MKWNSVDHKHHGRLATVTPPKNFPDRNAYTGIVQCEEEHTIPYLLVGKEVHMFAWWYDVTFLVMHTPS